MPFYVKVSAERKLGGSPTVKVNMRDQYVAGVSICNNVYAPFLHWQNIILVQKKYLGFIAKFRHPVPCFVVAFNR